MNLEFALSEGTGHPRRPVPQACFGYVPEYRTFHESPGSTGIFPPISGRRIRHCRGIFEKHNYIFRKLSKMAEKKSPYSSFFIPPISGELALGTSPKCFLWGICYLFIYYYKKLSAGISCSAVAAAVKYSRNASAHNNAMLNNMKPRRILSPIAPWVERMAAMKIAVKGARKTVYSRDSRCYRYIPRFRS